MNQTSRVMRRYLAQVRRALRCPRKERQALLSRLRADLAEYAAQQPALSFDDLTEQFGSPAQLAADYLETLDPAELKRFQSAAVRRIWAAAAGFCLLLAAAIGGYSVWSLRHPVQVIPGDDQVPPEMAAEVKASHCMFDFLVLNYAKHFCKQAADGSYPLKQSDEQGLYTYLYIVGVTPDLLRGTEEPKKYIRGTKGLGYDTTCTNPYIEGYIQWFNDPDADHPLVWASMPSDSSESEP